MNQTGGSPRDALVEREDMAAVISIVWPLQPIVAALRPERAGLSPSQACHCSQRTSQSSAPAVLILSAPAEPQRPWQGIRSRGGPAEAAATMIVGGRTAP
jgi:hypothetical protein